MNKTEFIKTLSEETGYSIQECEQLNTILEENFFLSKKSKDIIVKRFQETLCNNKEEAELLYEKARDIVRKEIKNKLMHPFQDQDE